MGFECTFKFCKKNDNGHYDHAVQDEFKKTLGKTEEVSLKALAKFIFNQLARRDILITDVKIIEFVKKEISFKETKNGISIKGVKFEFESLENEHLVKESTDIPAQHPQANKTIQINTNFRHEIFDPSDPVVVKNLLSKNIVMTIGKRYPIMEEKTGSIKLNENGSLNNMEGLFYVTKDDNGKTVSLVSYYFRPEDVVLSYQNKVQTRESGGYDENMIDIRRKRR